MVDGFALIVPCGDEEVFYTMTVQGAGVGVA